MNSLVHKTRTVVENGHKLNMKYILSILLSCFSVSSFSQVSNIKFPKFPLTGKSKSDFIPIGWTIRDTVVCDFNNDSLSDIAVVVETKQPVVSKSTNYISSQPFFPKILLVLLKQPDRTLVLSTKATKLFGDGNWGVQGADPFEKLTARRNTLGVTFLTGGTLRDWLTYYFRLQNNDWYLIGAESYQYSSGPTYGEEPYYNEKINLLTGEKETYDEDQNKKQKNYKKTKIKRKALIKLKSLEENSSPFSDN